MIECVMYKKNWLTIESITHNRSYILTYKDIKIMYLCSKTTALKLFKKEIKRGEK